MAGWVAPEQASLRTADAAVLRRMFEATARDIAALKALVLERSGVYVGPTPPDDITLVWVDTS